MERNPKFLVDEKTGERTICRAGRMGAGSKENSDVMRLLYSSIR